MNKTKIDIEKEDWQLLIEQLIVFAKKKYGTGFRLKIHEADGINRNRLTRFFQSKNPPRLDTLFLILNALDYEIQLKKKKN